MKRFILLLAMFPGAGCQSEATSRQQNGSSSKPQAATGSATTSGTSTATSTASGTDSATSTATAQTVSGVALKGTWLTGCVEQQILEASFDDDGAMVRKNRMFDNDACSGNPAVELLVGGRFTLGEEGGGLRSIDIKLEEAQIAHLSQAAFEEAQAEARCGIEWTFGTLTAVPVTCDFVSGGNVDRFDLVGISGDVLKFGDAKAEGTSVATRATTLENKHEYKKAP